MMKLHETARMHGKCVTATQSCRTVPFLVLWLINEHIKDMEGKVGKVGGKGYKRES